MSNLNNNLVVLCSGNTDNNRDNDFFFHPAIYLQYVLNEITNSYQVTCPYCSKIFIKE